MPQYTRPACRYIDETASKGVLCAARADDDFTEVFRCACGARTVIVAVAFAVASGLSSLRSQLDRGFADSIHSSQVSTTLGENLSPAAQVALTLATTTDRGQREALNATLDQTIVPGVDDGLSQLRALHAPDGVAERARVERLVQGGAQFVALRDTGVLSSQSVGAGGLGTNREQPIGDPA